MTGSLLTGAPPVGLDALREILLTAGAVVRRWYAAPASVQYKADGSPLTMADREVNGFLRAELGRLLPKAAWLSEEDAASPARGRAEWVWVVDPLDGTKEFVRKIPEMAVSIGLVHQDAVVLGGVANPLTGEGGVGRVGAPARFWGMRPSSAAATSLAEAAISVSRTEMEAGDLVPYARTLHLRVVGSVAYKLLRVAAGADDATFSVQPKSEWDVCGGAALLLSAGKTYRRADGEPLRFNQPSSRITCGSAAGDPAIVAGLLALMAQYEPSLRRDER